MIILFIKSVLVNSQLGHFTNHPLEGSYYDKEQLQVMRGQLKSL